MSTQSPHLEQSPVVVPIPKRAVVAAVDTALSNTCSGKAGKPSALVIDLSDCEFIEVASLITVLATAARRSKEGLATQFQLPRAKPVRDFLRRWNFPDAVYSATRTTFYKSVDETSKGYFGENAQEPSVYPAATVEANGHIEELLIARFFGICAFSGDQVSRPLALREAVKWKQKVVGNVLRNVLQGPAGFFPSRIVYEAMMNATPWRATHPGNLSARVRFKPTKPTDPFHNRFLGRRGTDLQDAS